MIIPGIYISTTEKMGRGVFTSENIEANTVIEISPVIVMTKDERKLLDQTLLHDYIFEWGEEKEFCCMAMGYVPLYNHSYRSNCEYEMPARMIRSGGNFQDDIITIKTMRPVQAGEELLINYNGTWNDDKPVWVDVK